MSSDRSSMSINDNNKGSETYPTWSTHRPSSSNTPCTEKKSRTSSRSSSSPRNSNSSSSTPQNSPRISYADSTTPMASSSIYGRDPSSNQERRGFRASGLSAGSNSTPRDGSSPSRSRSRGAWGEHRLSAGENVWTNNVDKERKHKKGLAKFMEHKLVPSFLE